MLPRKFGFKTRDKKCHEFEFLCCLDSHPDLFDYSNEITWITFFRVLASILMRVLTALSKILYSLSLKTRGVLCYCCHDDLSLGGLYRGQTMILVRQRLGAQGIGAPTLE